MRRHLFIVAVCFGILLSTSPSSGMSIDNVELPLYYSPYVTQGSSYTWSYSENFYYYEEIGSNIIAAETDITRLNSEIELQILETLDGFPYIPFLNYNTTFEVLLDGEIHKPYSERDGRVFMLTYDLVEFPLLIPTGVSENEDFFDFLKEENGLYIGWENHTNPYIDFMTNGIDVSFEIDSTTIFDTHPTRHTFEFVYNRHTGVMQMGYYDITYVFENRTVEEPLYQYRRSIELIDQLEVPPQDTVLPGQGDPFDHIPATAQLSLQIPNVIIFMTVVITYSNRKKMRK